MQNKDMEDRLRDTLKDYPSSLDKVKMYQDFEKIYGEKSKDKFALIFIFFGVMVIGAGFWMGQNRTSGSEAFSELSGNRIDLKQEVNLSELTIELATAKTKRAKSD